jgi:hypothetical protein
VAVLFGTLMAAAQANEFMVQLVTGPDTAAARDVPADCREDEAEEEEVSVAECELMVANVKIMIASRPPWFRSFQMGLACVSALAALVSILVGFALVDYRRSAAPVAVVAFAALLALDTVAFTAALYTGPLLRATYLWNIVIWFSIHLCLTAGALAGRREESLRSPTAEAAAV